MESQVLKCCFTPLNDQDDCGQKWQLLNYYNYLKETYSTTTG